MTVVLQHSFVDPASDLPGFTGVKPSNWNGTAAHTLTGAASSLLGFDTGGNPIDGWLFWASGVLAGGTGAASTLTLESTTGVGTSDAIFIKTGSQVEAARIDTSQQITVGGFANTFGAKFEIVANPNSFVHEDLIALGANNSAAAIFFNKTRATSPATQTIVSSGDMIGALNFKASDGAAFQYVAQIVGIVDGTPAANVMPGRLSFYTNSGGTGTTEILQITSGGVLNALKGQIQFPATQNASSNVNTLDDYVEGTWTPSLGGSATYTAQTGTYTKIGRLVFIQLNMTINAIGTGSTNTISGLPFAPAIGCGLGVGYFATIAGGNVVYLSAEVQGGATTIVCTTLSAAGITLSYGTAVFGSGTQIRLSGCYSV